jgi:hypothetical protein
MKSIHGRGGFTEPFLAVIACGLTRMRNEMTVFDCRGVCWTTALILFHICYQITPP